MSKQLFDLMAEQGRAALDNDSVYNEYLKLSQENKKLADLMAEQGRAALDNDSVYNEYLKYDTSKKEYPIKQIETSTDWEAAFPRASKAETGLQMLGGGILDIASAPGRDVAALIGATASKLGGGDFQETARNIQSRSGGDPSTNLGSQLVEGAVKDPFAIPLAMTGGLAAAAGKVPQIVAQIAKHPKLGSALLHGVAEGIENVLGGAAERFVAPGEKVLDADAMAWEGGLGTILGGAGKLGADWLKGLGDTEVGRAILKKITPNKVITGEPEKLGTLIRQGFGVDVFDSKTGRPDAEKLGAWLSEQSRGSDILSQLKYSRVPEWIANERAAVGKEIGQSKGYFSGEDTKINPKSIELLPEKDQIDIMRIQQNRPEADITVKSTPIVTDLRTLIESAKQDVGVGKSGRSSIVSEPEIQNFVKDIEDLLPYKIDPTTGDKTIDYDLDPTQLSELRDFLYNAGKESSLKYHPSREQFATSLRKLISNFQSDLLGKKVGPEAAKLPKKYAALMDLEELAAKSPILNPDRPSFLEGGILATGGRNLGSLASKAGELPTGVKRIAKEAIQSMIRTPSRTSERSEISVFRSLEPADQRVFARAQDRLRFDPNDREARRILDSYMNR